MSIPSVTANFAYTAAIQAKLADMISSERLRSYIIASGGSLASALELYVWNCSASAALYGPLQSVEIALRNAIHNALVVYISPDWPTDPKFLAIDPRLAQGIVDARRYVLQTWVRKNTPPETPASDIVVVRTALEAQATAGGTTVLATSRIVAELSCGFWVAMFKNQYQHTLFGPVLSRVLPPRVKRGHANAALTRLKDLRNRIAHHEPIHHLALGSLYGDILQVAGWLSPELSQWIGYHSRCPLLIDDKPRQRQQF